MTYHDEITNEYFEWLVSKVSGFESDKRVSFRKLLEFLHTVPFRWIIGNDKNRAEDGINLRFRFAVYKGEEDDPDEILDILDGVCSVLEMMVAISIRCEEFMDDPSVGNRTPQWFWGMINNLGLGSMYDDRFDKGKADTIIQKFLNRDYKSNGKGGLFYVRHAPYDVRDAEIWYQMCWYLDQFS